jgi:uncharacterized protein YjbI with pentapeptide repeats
MAQPEVKDDALYRLLCEGKIKEFNARRAGGETVDLRGAYLRGADLRNLEASGLDMSDCYLRHADLRGVDFSGTRLEGASISGARISGTYFPRELSAEEINLSLLHGTRMRYNN